MRALLQRVTRAAVRVDGRVVGEIGSGLVVLVGIGRTDDRATADALAVRIAGLRMFRDAAGRTNRSIREVGGSALVVSQFTLYADVRRGRRPGFSDAAAPGIALQCYERLCSALEGSGVPVSRGQFGAEMSVELANDGPFTIWLDTAVG